MTSLQIQLFGDFQLVDNGALLTTLHQARLQSLLAYLVLHRAAPQARRRLAFLFWPDSTDAQAQANLRQLLHRLHQVLPRAADFLHMATTTVQWRPDAAFTLDVAEFERHLAQADAAARTGDDAAVQAALQTAVACYRGDLLLGCYDDWVLPERERWQAAYINALERLILLAEAQRAHAVAIDYAQRLLRYDPLHETTYGHLMRLHALHGDRASALRVYHTCATLLQRELGVAPNPQTRAAYEQLLNREGSPELPSIPDTEHATLPAQVRNPARASTQQGEQLIGRRAEWQTLLTAWRRAANGHAQFLVVAGEAGIGKTRLAEELATWVNRQGIRTADTRAYAAEGALAYAPVAEWLRTEALRVGWQGLATVWLTELARLLPELLVEQPRLPHPAPMSESWQRKRLFEALARAVLMDNHPLLLVLDDLQWCDPETLEWLHYLLRYASQAPLLIVGTVRPEEVNSEHPLTTLLLDLRRTDQITELELGPLNIDETAALAVQVTGQNLALDIAQRLYRETEGNPLFVVETAHMESSKEMGAWENQRELPPFPLSPGSSPSLPPKVYAVIQRRLAQLSPATRELASLAAVIGRSFTVAVLAQASDLAEDVLVRGLDELWQRRIAREQGSAAYDFSHDRIRDVAYAAISPARRRWLHRRVAQGLETIHAGDLDPVSGQIATHYEHAGLVEQAIPYCQGAAEVAQRTYAHADAIHYLTKGLALLTQLPVTAEHIRRELSLQLSLALSLHLLKGASAQEARMAYERAEALSIQVGDNYRHLVASCGQFGSAVTGGQLQKARELAEQAFALARQLENPRWLAETQGMLGVVLEQFGEWAASRVHLEQALARFNFQTDASLTLFHDLNNNLLQRRHLAIVLWHLGYPDQALERMNETVALAQALAQPHNLASVLMWSAWLHQHRREAQFTKVQAETAITLCKQQGLFFPLAESMILAGWALAQQGQGTEGMARIDAGFAGRQGQQYLPAFLALLAETHGQIEQPEQGLCIVGEALAIGETAEEHVAEAELYRLKGELLQLQGAAGDESESCLQQAIDIARQQNAKSLELRAAMSLARLWRTQGKRIEAHQLLSPIYAWFTEGFDTLDLQEARTLLEALA